MARIELAQEIERLRDRLLDTSLRNPLLNYRKSARRTLQIVDELPDGIYARLVDDQRPFGLDAVPESKIPPEGIERTRSTALGIGAFSISLPTGGQADSNGGSPRRYSDDRLQTDLPKDRLDTLLRIMGQEAQSILDETGINYLHLALGFLAWRESDVSDAVKLAPLILIPVAIERTLDQRSGQYRFVLSWNGDDVSSNISLLRKLESDFGIRLPEFDQSGTPEQYWRDVYATVSHKPGWQIAREALLGFFSFHKLSMYADLDPKNWEGSAAFSDDSLLSALVVGQEQNGQDGLYAKDYEIDQHAGATDIHLPTDADSSQHSALCDIAAGKSLVIEGPPGTGKSQTITNAIAHAISSGKTVLFVAEKLAALEVVSGRLENLGLAPFCLELHSDSAAPRHVMESMLERLDSSLKSPRQIEEMRSRLKSHQSELKGYLTATSKCVGPHKEPLYDLLWRVVQLRNAGLRTLRTAKFNFNADLAEFERASLALEALTRSLTELPKPRESAWWGYFPEKLNPNDDSPVRASLATLRAGVQQIDESLDQIVRTAGGDRSAWAAHVLSIDLEELKRLGTAEPPLASSLLSLLRNPRVAAQTAMLVQKIRQITGHRQVLRAALVQDDQESLSLLSGAAGIVANSLKAFSRKASIAALAKYRAWLETTAEALRRLIDVVSTLEAAQLGPIRTISELDEARSRLALALHPSLGGAFPITQEMFFDAARGAWKAGVKRSTKVQEQEVYLAGHLHLPSRPPREQVLTILAQLRRHATSPFRFFRSEYRTAMAMVKSFFRPEKKPSALSCLTVLETLETWESEKDSLENDSNLLKTFGDNYRGAATDWEQIKTLFNWIATAKSRGLDYPAAAQLVARTNMLPPDCTPDAIRGAIQAFEKQGVPENLAPLRIQADELRRVELRSLLRRLERTSEGLAQVIEAGRCLKKGSAAMLDEVCAVAAHSESLLELERVALAAESFEGVPDPLYQAAVASPDDVARSQEWVAKLESAHLPDSGVTGILTTRPAPCCATIAEAVQGIFGAICEWDERRRTLAGLGTLEDTWLQLVVGNELNAGISESLDRLEAEFGQLPAWAAISRTLQQCRRNGVSDFAQAAISGEIKPVDLVSTYQYTLFERLAEQELSSCELDSMFSRQHLETLRESFQKVDRELMSLNRLDIAAKAARRTAPEGNARGRVSELTELSLIRHEIQKQRRHCRIRDLIVRAGKAMQALKPCFLMSPLSVSRFIPAQSIEFDLVIMDEASQIKPEDAIGTILRAKQLVVVGDPKQLPPTSFFDKMGEDVDDEESTQFDNAESILQVAMKAFQPYRRLRWHYRSRHESLIQFSNLRFYDDDLVIFPAPGRGNEELGIRHHFIEGGHFSGNVNLAEASAIVARIIEHAKTSQESLGVGTFNAKQAELIRDLLEKACDTDALARVSVEKLRTRDEGLFVKNLESLQGDERDVILISYTYGPDPQSGRVMQRFGPINSESGWRRLNVLVTRARNRMEVFSSMLPSDIQGGPDKSRGVNAYKDFLEYAMSGSLPDRGIHTGRGPDSPFEESVARVLASMGVEAVPQVGVAGYFIDIGVRERGRSEFILGIECDGSNYHSTKSARDRDRLREEVIRSRGWKLHRIWSTDWFLNQKHEEQRLCEAVGAALRR